MGQKTHQRFMKNCFLFFLKFYMKQIFLSIFCLDVGGVVLILFGFSTFGVMWDWKNKNVMKF